MEHNSTEQSIREKVLEQIRSGKVRVRPRAYFMARLASVAIVAIAALVISVFVVSFVFFSIHESGEQFLLGFGGRGVITFFILFPWLLLILDIAVILLLEWLIRGFKFAYRIPLATVFAGIFIVSTLLGVFVAATPMHRGLLDLADHDTLPVIGGLYESVHDSHAEQGIIRGTITSISDNEVIVTHEDHDRDADDGRHRVVLPPGAPQLSVGDHVYIFGTNASSGTNVLEARGVERYPDEW